MNMLAADEEALLEASMMSEDDNNLNMDAVVVICGNDDQKYVVVVTVQDESNPAGGECIQTDSETHTLPVIEDVACIESNILKLILQLVGLLQ